MRPRRIFLRIGDPQKKYSTAFKRELVRVYEQGILNNDQIHLKFESGDNSKVLECCYKYGKF